MPGDILFIPGICGTQLSLEVTLILLYVGTDRSGETM